MKKLTPMLVMLVCFSTFGIFTSTLSAQQFELQLTKSTITAGPVKYGVDIPYNLTISNNGTDSVQNVVLRDFVGPGYTFDPGVNAGWSIDPADPDAVLFTFTGAVPPNEDRIVTLLLNINAAPNPQDWDNMAEIVSFEDRGGVDRTGEDTVDDNEDNSTVPIFDLALTNELITTGDINYGDTLVFRATVTNQGNQPTGEVTITDYIPEGYDNIVDVNVAAGWTSTAVNPMFMFPNIPVQSTVTADISLVLTMDMVNADAWDNYIEITRMRNAGGSLVFIDADSDLNSNTDAERTVKPGDLDDNYIGNMPINVGFQDDHDPAGPTIYDLAVRKERLTGPPSYSYGQGITYSIDIFNQGNEPIFDIIYRDTLPCGIEDLDLSNNPGWTYDPATRVATKTIAGPIAAASSDRDTINLEVRPCYTDPYSAWTNIVEIAEGRDADGNIISDIDSQADGLFTNDPGGIPGSATDNAIDGNGVIDEDDHDIEAIEIVDMAIRKTVITEGPYTDGQLVDFNIRVFNQGNVEAVETFIEEFVPIGFTYEQAINGPLGWSQPVTAGATTIDRLANTISEPILAGDSTDITLSLRLNLTGVDPEDWYNYAHVLISRDSLGNNRFDDADSNPFTETEEERSVIPGDSNDDNILTLGENAGQDQDDHDPATISFFDLSLTKMQIGGTVAYGNTLDFTIAVENQGNQVAKNIEVIEYIPCGLVFDPNLNADNMQWSFDVTSSTATVVLPDSLRPGESVDVSISLVLTACDEANAYTNVAEIAASTDGADVPTPVDGDQDSTPDTDPDNDPPGEDDIDETTIDVFDLTLSKAFTTQPTSTSVGSQLDYTIVVTNEGNVTATNVVVEDRLPCGLDFTTSTGWVGGGSTISYAVAQDILPGQSVTIPLTLWIGTCAVGETVEYANIAEISQADGPNGSPVSDVDSTPGNDDENEDDQDSQPFDVFDLSLSKMVVDPSPYEYGQIVEYQITIANEGTVEAVSYAIEEDPRCGLEFVYADNPNWNIDILSGRPTLTVNTPLSPGASATYAVFLTVRPCTDAAAPFAYFNFAEISAASDPDGPADDQDSTPGNGNPSEDDLDSEGIDVFDLSLEKTVTSTAVEYEEGDLVSYSIVVTNEGNLGAETFTVTDALPCNLELSATSTDWTANADGTVSYTGGPLLPGFFEEVVLEAVVVPCLGADSQAVNSAEITEASDPDGNPLTDADSTPDNNDPTEDDQDDAVITILSGALVGDFVWDDLDGDGIQNGNEPGIPGVTINVYDDNQELVLSTVTDANGGYEVELPVGTYYIEFLPGGTYEPTLQGAGSEGNDSNISDTFGPGTTDLFTVENGIDDFTVDAGFYECVNISGIAWYDVNEDDIRQDFENGINGLPAKLFRLVGGVWTLWAEETTHHDWSTPSDDGLWDFCVSPGTYYVEIEMPPLGLVRVRPFVGGSNVDSDINNANGQNTTPQFTLVSGQSKTDLGAGYYPMATVGNSVWLDENGNGLQETGEARLAGVEVIAYDTEDNMIKSTVTDAEGRYKLDYLEKQTYYLEFVPPVGYSFTQHIADEEDMNSDVTHYYGANTTNAISLLPGMEVVNIDAGVQLGILPVTWVDVSATAAASYNEVEWTTAAEVNNDHFEVERSTDGGRTFVAIGKVMSRASGGLTDYSYLDRDTETGTTYYRVKQVDLDGTSTYSKIVEVRREEDKAITLYPNPATDLIHIEGGQSSQAVVIYDATGRIVVQHTIVGTEITTLNISALPNGVYSYTIVESGSNVTTGKLIKI